MKTETITLTDIEKLCLNHSSALTYLDELVISLKEELEKIKQAKIRAIRSAVQRAAVTEISLRQAIQAAPDLFEKPKTQVFHGIQVGYRKGQDGIDWEDDEALVAKIEKLFPDDHDDYLLVHRTPSKNALKKLDAMMLRKLGVLTEEGSDLIVCKATDSAVEKMVNGLLKHTVDEAME